MDPLLTRRVRLSVHISISSQGTHRGGPDIPSARPKQTATSRRARPGRVASDGRWPTAWEPIIRHRSEQDSLTGMDLRRVRYFVVVAEELNFGRAATRLRMAQPPLSVQIQALEKELGAKLFDRTPRGVCLTKEGEVFLDEARLLLYQSEVAQRSVHRAASGKLGTLRVGGVSSAFHKVLPRVVPVYKGAYPDVNLQLRELDTADAVNELRSGTLDIAFVRAGNVDDSLELRAIHEDYFCLAVPEDHQLAGKVYVDLEELAAELFVMPRRAVSPDFHDHTLTTLRSSGYSPRIAFEGASIQSMLSFVACGLGVALVPASAQAWNFAAVKYIPLATPVSFIEVAVVWSRNRVPPAVRNFLAVLGEVT